MLDRDNLIELDLSINNLSHIDSNVFNDLKSLTYLNLSFNRLEFIEKNLMRPLINLVKLDLSHNRIKHIDDESFLNLIYLLSLNNLILYLYLKERIVLILFFINYKLNNILFNLYLIFSLK